MSASRIAERSAAYAPQAAVQPAFGGSFELLATAPKGVAKLRELILSLAVRGKLVDQRPDDEPASDLIRQFKEGKANSVAAGVIRREKSRSAITADELPYELPQGWQLIRLGELLIKIGAGSTPRGGREAYTAIGVKFLRSQNVWNSGLKLDGVAHIPKAVHEHMSGTKVVAGDLLFNITGASIGRCALVPDDFDEANVSQHVTIIRVALAQVRQFLHLVLTSPHVQQTVMDVQVGVSREGLSIGKLGQFVVPVPPLAEQARIVARVEELMQLCDVLEAHGRLQDAQHARLVATLFDALAASASAEALAESWQRIATHFDLLLDRPAAVDALEQTLLQLAVRGLLVPQDPSDEPASEVLGRLSQKALKTSSKKKLLTSIVLAGKVPPYELPEGWGWAPLYRLMENMGSGWSPACDEGERSSEDRWAVLRTTAVQVMEFRPRENKAIPSKLEGRSNIQITDGDILITRAGPMNRVGISCCVDHAPPRLMLSDKIVRFQIIGGEMVPAFVVLALNAGWPKDQLEAAKTGMAASQVNISQTDLQQIQVAVCSKAEQHRIVARVEQLRRLCAELRERLQQSRATQSRLADALVALAGG